MSITIEFLNFGHITTPTRLFQRCDKHLSVMSELSLFQTGLK